MKRMLTPRKLIYKKELSSPGSRLELIKSNLHPTAFPVDRARKSHIGQAKRAKDQGFKARPSFTRSAIPALTRSVKICAACHVQLIICTDAGLKSSGLILDHKESISLILKAEKGQISDMYDRQAMAEILFHY